MQIVTASMFTRPPFKATIDLMYLYQKYHGRMMETAREMDELRNRIMSNMERTRLLDYYRDPFEIDIMI